MYGYTGGVYLGEGEVRQICAFLESLNGGRAVAAHSVCRQEECTAVTAGGEYHGVCGVAFDFAGDEVADDDTACAAVDYYHVEHLAAVERANGALFNLAVERAVGAKQELLAGLAFGVECTAYLSAAERTVGEEAAVFAGEGNALLHALVDDVVGNFGKTVHVGFARAEVAAFDSVVEEAVYGVAVVLIVLGSVDTALCGDGVRAAGAVLYAEVVYVEAHFAECGGCGGACEAGTYDDDVEVALVGGVYKVLVGFVVGPFLSDRTFRNLGVDSVLRQIAGFDVGEVLHDGAGVYHALKVEFLCHISERLLIVFGCLGLFHRLCALSLRAYERSEL